MKSKMLYKEMISKMLYKEMISKILYKEMISKMIIQGNYIILMYSKIRLLSCVF